VSNATRRGSWPRQPLRATRAAASEDSECRPSAAFKRRSTRGRAREPAASVKPANAARAKPTCSQEEVRSRSASRSGSAADACHDEERDAMASHSGPSRRKRGGSPDQVRADHKPTRTGSRPARSTTGSRRSGRPARSGARSAEPAERTPQVAAARGAHGCVGVAAASPYPSSAGQKNTSTTAHA